MTDKSKDVIEVSKKCSTTAEDLLAELRKLQSGSGDGMLQAIKKSTRALRRKGKIKEIEQKLGKYQAILNTRILSKLDAHAVQHNVKFGTLDQNVKHLAVQLSQGHKAFDQSLTNQTMALRTQLDNQVHTQAIERMKQQFKDSLFFPEMFARQDDIPSSHKGTCRWIFDPPRVKSSDSSDDSSDGKDSSRDVRAPPWDDFTTWLGNDEDIYW